jgi:hypothetical protein
MTHEGEGTRSVPARIWFRYRHAMLAAGFAGIVAYGLLLRWIHLVHSRFMYDGDDAFIALIALHISRGRDFPLIQYHEHYMGTLDAYITALLFYWFGAAPELHKLTLLLYAGLALLLLGWTAWRLWGWREAYLVAGLFAAAPSAIRWQMDSNSNYGILLAFETGMMALAIPVLFEPVPKDEPRHLRAVGLWALVCGIAFWMHSLSVSLFLSLLVARWTGRLLSRKTTGIALGGFLLGASPLLVHNWVHPFSTVKAFAGRFLDIASRRQVDEGSLLTVILRGVGKHVNPLEWGNNLLAALRGPGLGSAPSLTALGILSLVVLAALVLSALIAWSRQAGQAGLRSREGALLSWLLLSAVLVILLGSTRSRYMSLLLPILGLVVVGRWTGAGLGRGAQQMLLLVLLSCLAALSVTLNVVKPVDTSNPFPGLVSFLESKGLRRGYADYNIAHPIILYSQERIIVSSFAGPVMRDRFPRYMEEVERADSPFYIYKEQEPLGERLAAYLERSHVHYDRTLVEQHLVVWNLSRAVRPDEFLPDAYRESYQQERRSTLGAGPD